jgi:hypothetical protein
MGVIMNLTLEIQQLSHFSEQEGISEIITALSRLSDTRSWFEATFYARPDMSDTERQSLIDDLRTKLHVILVATENDFEVYTHASLATASHNALLVLAKLSPINEDDPTWFTNISSEKQVVIAAGYQYDIDSLIEFQKKRPARKETNEARRNYKSLIDPRTNLAFSARDSAHIQRVAALKGMTIPWLVRDEADAPNMIKIAEEFKQLMAQKSADEIADLLVQLDDKCGIYGDNLASTLKNALPKLQQAKKLLNLQGKLEKTAPKLQKAKNLLNSMDNLFWRAPFILGGCTVLMFGYALECLLSETGTCLDPFTSMLFETGLLVGGGLALYGLMATPKITKPSLEQSDIEGINFVSTLQAPST